MKIHRKTHESTKKELSCNYCDKTYGSKRGLEHHQQQKHSNTSDHECQECSKSYKQKRMLLSHMQATHKPKQFHCKICDKKFAFGYELNTHVEYKHNGKVREKNIECPTCQKTFSRKFELKQHSIMHMNPQFECSECKRMFHTKKILKSHMIIHTQDKPYKCSKCDLAYNNGGTLSRHMRTLHLGFVE